MKFLVILSVVFALFGILNAQTHWADSGEFAKPKPKPGDWEIPNYDVELPNMKTCSNDAACTAYCKKESKPYNEGRCVANQFSHAKPSYCECRLKSKPTAQPKPKPVSLLDQRKSCFKTNQGNGGKYYFPCVKVHGGTCENGKCILPK